MKRHWLMRATKIAVFAVIAIAAIGGVVMTLWNWLAPGLFGGHAIGFWQAIGLFALARLLVGGLRGHGGHRMHWRQRMVERWDRMSEDERAKVREAMQYRCGHRGRHIAAQEPAPPAV